MAYTLQFRRDIAANWTTNNPTLLQGEIGYETDTDQLKIGNGVDDWSTLAYWTGPQGDTGFTGSQGVQGVQGVIGYTGSSAAGGSSTEISSTAPESPEASDMWFDATNGSLNIYYDDGDTAQWVGVSGSAGPTGPTGYTGSQGPSGYTGSAGASSSVLTGDTASRPASVSEPTIYYNTDSDVFEYYDLTAGTWNEIVSTQTVVQPATNSETTYAVGGTYSFVPPEGVTMVSVVCVGSGGNDGGGGGGIAWINDIPVTPGQSYAVYVGSPNTASPSQGSYFIDSSTCFAEGGGANGIGGSYTVEATAYGTSGGGNGGTGDGNSAGGGTAGYTGNGGNSYNRGQSSGTGGGGGGGGPSDGGGGVGLYGEGTSGAYSTSGGRGGSGGQNGADNGPGGNFGGGGGNNYLGGGGAVRIIWGPNRAFPSTNTGRL